MSLLETSKRTRFLSELFLSIDMSFWQVIWQKLSELFNVDVFDEFHINFSIV